MNVDGDIQELLCFLIFTSSKLVLRFLSIIYLDEPSAGGGS